MSLPYPDPNMTISELQKLGDDFLKAGKAYWEGMHKARMGGALVWIEAPAIGLVIFTRGEYRDALLTNTPEIGPVYHLGGAAGDGR